MLAAVGVSVIGLTTFVGVTHARVPVVRAEDGACTTADGVTVVIDFQQLGGGVYVRCAEQPVGDGFAALRQAGVAFQTAVRQPGFLCRIAGLPSDDPCVNESPSDAYWGYWLAPRGGAWCYSSVGAGNRTPPPGTVEGWSFAKDAAGSAAPRPGIAPPPPLPGIAPTALAATDCGTTEPVAASTTTTTTTTIPVTDPPTTPAPAGTQAPPPPADAPTTDAPAPTAAPLPRSTTPPRTTAPRTTTTTTAPAVTPTDAVSTTTSPTTSTPTSTSTSTTTSTTTSTSTTSTTSTAPSSTTTSVLSSTTVAPRRTINLGSNGTNDGGGRAGLIWTGVGVAAIAGAGTRAAFVLRRRRLGDHVDP